MSKPHEQKKQSGRKRASAHASAARPVTAEPTLPLVPAPVAPEKILPYNDIDVSRWRDYEHVETGSLWVFNGRDRQNGHQLDYHGNCVPQILTQLLTRYTKQGDVILDLFLGSGTSAIEAVNLGRRAIGVELQPEMAAYVRDKLQEQGKLSDVGIINGDSSNADWTGRAIQRALKGFEKEKAQFLFLHPPYADIIRFSEAENDLSNANSTEAFLDQFEKVCQLGHDMLEPGRFAGLVIGDKYENGELIPLSFQCMERLNRVGFKTKSIIVKNINGNEKAKGRMNNLWRYRALMGGFYIFKHEYVILFHKPVASKKKKSL
jgi:16S rRNA G966 N2-methylase RsmD